MLTHQFSARTALNLLLLGIFVSALGTGLSSIGFSLLAAQAGQSYLMAAVLAANLAPGVVLGLLGGHLADKHLKWWWWPASLVINACIMATVALTLHWGIIIAGCALMSSCTALVGPVAQKLVAHYSLDAAKTGAHLATVQGLAGVVGVALGGVGFGAGIIQWMLAADALAMLLFAGLGALVATPGVIVLDDASDKTSWTTGVRLLYSPGVFGLLGFALIITTVTSTSLDDVSGVFALTYFLGLTPQEFGVTSAAWGAGVICGGWMGRFIGDHPVAQHPLTALPIGIALGSVGLFQPSFAVIILLFWAGGAGNGMFNAVINRVIIGSVSQEFQGRAWAGFRWVVYVCLLAGYAIAAFAGQELALQLMAVAGISVTVCSCLNLIGQRRARRKKYEI